MYDRGRLRVLPSSFRLGLHKGCCRQKKENYCEFKSSKVDWKPFDPPREWYFYTNRSTVWRVLPGDWIANLLTKMRRNGRIVNRASRTAHEWHLAERMQKESAEVQKECRKKAGDDA